MSPRSGQGTLVRAMASKTPADEPLSPGWLAPLVNQDDPRLGATEAWFQRAGVPHFIEGYSSVDRVTGRTVPVVAALVLCQLLLGSSWDGRDSARSWAQVIGILLVIQALWMLSRVAVRSHHRRLHRLQSDLGPVDTASHHRLLNAQRTLDLSFLLISSLVAALTHGAGISATLLWWLLNAAAAGVAYSFATYGGWAILRWAIRHTFEQLGSVGRLMTLAVPRIALIVVILLLTTETWQTAGSVRGPRYVWSLTLLYAAALAFSGRAARVDLARLGAGAGPALPAGSTLTVRCATTPAAELVGIPTDEQLGVAAAIPLNRRQRLNVAAVFAVALLVQVALVSLAVGLFVTALGALVVPVDTIDAWLAPLDTHVLWNVTQNVAITEELMRVVGFVMGFSALTFTVSAVTDQTFRADFYDGLVEPLGTVTATRTVYLAVRGGTSPG